MDSLNYDIPLSKLTYYGLEQNALRLITSYLEDRYQYMYVQLVNVKSYKDSTTCGIPQGSVLGSLLFNILINDITQASTKFDYIMYADDTTLASTLENFGSVNDVANMECELNQEITKVNSCLLSNKLTLNAAKSKYMIFFKVPKVVPRLNLIIAGIPIEQVNEFNFLGITLHQNITWKPHNLYPVFMSIDILSTLDCFGKNTDEIENSITYELQKVFKWFDVNKLCLNVSKSKFMLFHMPQKIFLNYHSISMD